MNNFQISGFVVNNATINQFATASVARFGISVRRTEKNGDSEKKVSAILNIEAWKNNDDAEAFNLLTKGTRLTVEGFFKPEEWTDKENVNHNTIKICLLLFLPVASVFGQGHLHILLVYAFIILCNLYIIIF